MKQERVIYHVKLTKDKHQITQFDPWIVNELNGSLEYPIRKITPLNKASISNLSKIDEKLIQIAFELNSDALEDYFNRNVKRRVIFENLLIDPKVSPLLLTRANRLINEFLTLSYKENISIVSLISRDDITQKYLLQFAESTLEPAACFTKTNDEIEYQLKIFNNGKECVLLNQQLQVLLDTPACIILNQKIYTLTTINANKLKPFNAKSSIKIPEHKISEYLSTFIKNIASKIEIEATGFELERIESKPKLNLTFVEDFLSKKYVLNYEFVYDNNVFSKTSKQIRKVTIDFNPNGMPIFQVLVRDFEKEKLLLSEFELHVFKLNDSLYFESLLFTSKYGVIQHIIELKNKLNKELFLIPLPEIDNMLIALEPSSISLNFQAKVDWFDLEIEVKIGEELVPFSKLSKNIQASNPFFKLSNGSYFIIPEEWMAKYSSLSKFIEVDNEQLRISKTNYTILEQIKTNEFSQEKILKPIEEFDFNLPLHLKATLRPYQYDGAKWLCHHQKNQLGALLADDMGLGKTIQTITALCYCKENQTKQVPKKQMTLFDVEENQEIPLCSILIMPTSLIFNWQIEIAKFAPQLSICNYTGPNRKRKHNELASFDIILTTYSTALLDIETLKAIEFNYIVLDESQYIKNRESKIFKALNTLKAKYRLSLSGTPIENSLSDLFSQMEFVNPNILGDYAFFKKNFQLPIEKEKSESALSELKTLIDPFIKRRLRNEVVGDLPELTEQLFYSEMSKSQNRIFEKKKSETRNLIFQNKLDGTVSQISILNALMSLRKISNHPILENTKYKDDSGKFTDVIEQLESLQKANHKILLFSSFTSHLDLYQSYFEKVEWKYVSLTGKDSTKKREEAVTKFNSDPDIKIFLMSLKAGGVGLNLTVANYVFILDPWWNPFAENQAIARAHRIGQTQKVNVIRFISKGSIEEKIIQLQQQKMVIANQLIDLGDQFLLQQENLKFILE